MMERGIIYLATGPEQAIEGAFLSAESVKRMSPGVHITLFTDQPRNLLCASSCFDVVETVQSETGAESDDTKQHLHCIKSLARTPYERTLHLSNDSRALSRAIPDVFKFLDTSDIALAEDSIDGRDIRKQIGRRLFNSSVMLFRRNDSILKFLARWEQELERNVKRAAEVSLITVPELAHIEHDDDQREILKSSQFALMQVLNPEANPLGLRVATLDDSWNFDGEEISEAINIMRSDVFKMSTKADILDVANAWVAAGREDEAEPLYDYVGTFGPMRQLRAYWPLALTCGSPDRNGEEWASPRLKRADLHINYQQYKLAAHILSSITESALRAHVLTGQARIALGSSAVADALDLIDQALAIAPHSSYAAIIQGVALMTASRSQDAIAPLSRAAEDGRAGAFFLLGLAWLKMEKYEEAADAYKKGIAFDPDDPGPKNNLLPTLLAARKYPETIEYADQVLARQTGHTTSLAFKCIALGETSRTDELSDLLDQKKLVVIEQLAQPAPFQDLAAFNRALAREIAADPTLAFERNTTRFGHQTDDVGRTTAPAIHALNEQLLAVAKRRARTEKMMSDHPFHQAAPRDFIIYSWGVIMENEGHQAPHFHPHGWLSGVYYIEVPDEISDSDPERNGWLEFGRGDARWHREETSMPTRQVLPKTGMLITFPSFFWHRTRPMHSKKPRISFAFDIIPI